MFVRVLTFAGAEHIDEGVQFIRDEAVPVLRQQHGYRGLAVSADRSGGVLGIVSRWETEADREASDSALAKTRQDGNRVIGGTMTVELFEEAVWEVAERPVAGSSVLRLRRTTMDPAMIDENLEFFRTVVVPELRSTPGFQAVRNMINRQDGTGLVGTVWADQAALETGEARGAARRQRATAERGVTVVEASTREIPFVEMG
jgi:heme-degrading monooxygenase HmoA